MNHDQYDPLDAFLSGLRREIGEDEWTPAVIDFGGSVRHRGKEITEDELRRRWEDEGPHGAEDVQAIDFRAPSKHEP